MKTNDSVKVVVIVSGIHKSLQLEWVSLGLKKNGINPHFILLGETDTEFSKFLKDEDFQVFNFQAKNVFDLVRACWNICFILIRIRPHVVHTHLHYASLVGLFAAWCTGVRKRIYTRHHSSFHHYYFPGSVRTDRFINWLASDIIAPCEKVKEVVTKWERTPAKKVHVIPHGFDLKYFSSIERSRVDLLRRRYNISDQQPVIGVISRYTHAKGIQYIIPAFRKLLELYPQMHLILANAQGDYSNEIKKLLAGIPSQSYTEITFETDLAALFQLFTIYIHVPIDAYSEAFGQTYVEALASEIPSIFTLSGIACDFIRPQENALVSPYMDSDSIVQSVCQLMKNSTMKNKLVATGLQSVQQFDIDIMTAHLTTLYQS